MKQHRLLNPNLCCFQLMNEQYSECTFYPINRVVMFDMKRMSQISNSVNFIRKFKQ